MVSWVLTFSKKEEASYSEVLLVAPDEIYTCGRDISKPTVKRGAKSISTKLSLKALAKYCAKATASWALKEMNGPARMALRIGIYNSNTI